MLNFRVSQGSTFGPFLFFMYSYPLCEIIWVQGLKYILYANESHFYISIPDLQTIISNCSCDISTWLSNRQVNLVQTLFLSFLPQICSSPRPISTNGLIILLAVHTKILTLSVSRFSTFSWWTSFKRRVNQPTLNMTTSYHYFHYHLNPGHHSLSID